MDVRNGYTYLCNGWFARNPGENISPVPANYESTYLKLLKYFRAVSPDQIFSELNQSLSRFLGLSARTLQRHLKVLVEHGYLSLTYNVNHAKHTLRRFQFFIFPESVYENWPLVAKKLSTPSKKSATTFSVHPTKRWRFFCAHNLSHIVYTIIQYSTDSFLKKVGQLYCSVIFGPVAKHKRDRKRQKKNRSKKKVKGGG